MAIVYQIILHLLILAAIASMIAVVFSLIFRDRNRHERVMRLIALSGGLLVFLGAKNSGISMPSLIFLSIDNTGGAIHAFLSFFLPGALGLGVTYMLFRSISNIDGADKRFYYFLIMLSTWICTLFIDSYLGSFSSESNTQLMTINISFVVGIIIMLLFNMNVTRSIYGLFFDSIKQPSTADLAHRDESNGNDWRNRY